MTQRTRNWLKENFQERDPQDFIDDLIDTFGIGIAQQVGDIFYVDPGVTSGDGQSPETAFGTMQEGIDACTANNGDVIVRMQGTETVTATINFNVGGILVVAQNYGLSPLAAGEYFATQADATFTDGPVATITARCTIAGLGFVSRDTGATFYSGAAMLIGGLSSALPFGTHILGCRFPKWNLANRIGIAVEGSSDVLIERCGFEGVGANLESGIYVQGATQNIEVRECRFRSCDYAITHGAFAGGGPHALYVGNICEDAKLLETGSNAATGLITGNKVETATDAATYDVTVAAAQALGLNFSGNDYSE